jgi:hypothetical protein
MREASGNDISSRTVLQSDETDVSCRNWTQHEPAVLRAQIYKDGHISTQQKHMRKTKKKVIRLRISSILNTFTDANIRLSGKKFFMFIQIKFLSTCPLETATWICISIILFPSTPKLYK